MLAPQAAGATQIRRRPRYISPPAATAASAWRQRAADTTNELATRFVGRIACAVIGKPWLLYVRIGTIRTYESMKVMKSGIGSTFRQFFFMTFMFFMV
jgi:hypothetical protein